MFCEKSVGFMGVGGSSSLVVILSIKRGNRQRKILNLLRLLCKIDLTFIDKGEGEKAAHDGKIHGRGKKAKEFTRIQDKNISDLCCVEARLAPSNNPDLSKKSIILTIKKINGTTFAQS